MTRIKNRLLVIISLLFCMGLSEQPIRYEYADGSGNLYRLSPTLIEYEPVQAEFSSSGIYSGGDAVKKSISPSDYEKLTQQLQAAINTPAIHIQHRLMGSGMIVIREQNKTRTVLLSQNAKEKINLEALLKKLLSD